MAATENGHALYGQKEKANGHAIGHSTISRKRLRPRKTWYSWTLHNIARLSVWYALITIIFRCPSNPKELTDTSPPICSSYLSTKKSLLPYVQPYYNTYASSYVEKAKPYYDQVNNHIIQPASTIAANNYQKYAVPQIDKAKDYTYSRWAQHVRPQLSIAQSRATNIYSASIEPHLAQVSTITTPYYAAARDNALNIHKNHVIPTVVYSKPHLEKAYQMTETFVVRIALPSVHYAWSNIAIFVEGTLWPFIKTVYSHNVRPQLVMISERIAKYQEGRKLQNIMDETEATTDASSFGEATTQTDSIPASPSGVTETLSSFIASIVNEASSAVDDVSSSVLPKSSRKVEYATEESVAEDLVKWQKKFAVAADQGTDDLRERIRDIVDGLVRSDVDGEGRGLADALERTTEVELQKVKAKINTIVSQLSDESSTDDETKAEEAVMQTIRDAGGEIRQRAKKLRDWAQTFENGVDQRTTLAADTTLQVLDSIRDLGLQEIGMRWAWMEGVQHTHWKKYHELRQRFDEWRDEVRRVATEHPAAQSAKELAETILEEGMATTETTAKELFRLKDVAKWKIRAKDASEDFDDRVIPAAAVSAASKVVEEVTDFASSIVGTTQGRVDSIVSQATKGADIVQSSASAAIIDNLGGAQSVLSDASSAVSERASSISSAVIGESTSAVSSAFSSVSDETIEHVATLAQEAVSSASSAILGSSSGSVESIASQVSSFGSSIVSGESNTPSAASSSISEVVSSASESIGSVASAISGSAASFVDSDVSSPVAESLGHHVSVASDAYDSASSTASSVVSSASSRVFAGAMAQEVKGQIPILDDIFDEDFSSHYSEQIQSMASEAGDRYADITKAISEAFYGTTQGTVESMTSIARNQYLSALSAASTALYGTPTPAAEKFVKDAADRYKEAVAAASSALFATKSTGIAESLLQQASSVYSDAVSRAGEYRSAAEEVVSKQMGATQKPIHSQMIESISSAYADSLAKASARLDKALSAASGQYTSATDFVASVIPTQGPVESLSSVASSRLQEALAAASAQYLSAKVAVGATPAPLTAQAQQNYYAAIGYAHDQYSSFLAAGSSAVYGTPTPVYQQLIAQATSRYSQASAAASSSLDAYLSSVSSLASKATKTKSPAQSVLDQASSTYSSILSVASASLLKASNDARVAVYGTPPPAYQSAFSSISSEYDAVTKYAAIYMSNLISSASSALPKGKSIVPKGKLSEISSRYNVALTGASESMSAAVAEISSGLYGPEKGSVESVASVASENWQQLLSQASEKVYGQPTPAWVSLTSQINEYSAQATDAAAERFVIVQHFVSELIVGKEPDFTESVMSRLSYAYYTGIAASASSLASEAYASGSSIAASISSAASAFFTTPPEVDSILDRITSQLNEAVEAASAQVYGTQKGAVEQATSAAAEAYASASSAASEAIYGTQVGYGEAASNSINSAAQQASEAISIAIWGTPTGYAEGASAVAASQYDEISSAMSSSLSVASEKAASVADVAKSKVSEAIYGPEQNAFDSAQAKILEAVESARSKIAGFGIEASKGAEKAASMVSENVESMASAVSENVSSVTERMKDEL